MLAHSVLGERMKSLSKSAVVLNSNMREQRKEEGHHCGGQEWVVEGTRAWDVVEAGGVKVSLGGYMSDERNMFRDGTFKGLRIGNVCETYDRVSEESKRGESDL